jgi:hypothetical protein
MNGSSYAQCATPQYLKTVQFSSASVHPETTNFWMEVSAVSEQQSANTLFLMSFAESRKLMTDSAHPKTLVSGWAPANLEL